MTEPHIKSKFFLILLAFTILFSLGFVSAAACWSYTVESGCNTNSSCYWKNDSWGGWCEELSCWSV